jgi:hypothetical protein
MTSPRTPFFCVVKVRLPKVADRMVVSVAESRVMREAHDDTRYVRNGDDQSPTSSSPVLTARCTMYVQKALNLNKGVKLCLSKIVGIILL